MQVIHVALIIVLSLSLNQAQSCKDYYRQDGKCVLLSDCPSLQSLNHQSWSFMDRLFLSGSECSGVYDKVKKYCCADGVETRSTTATTTTQRPPSLPLPPSKPEPGSGNCGLHTVDKIVGGNKTAIGEHPWLALLEYTWSDGVKDFRCGGSLINNLYVLTAAHCIKDYPRLTGVRLGEWDLSTNIDCQKSGPGSECSDDPQNFRIEEKKVYPGYRNAGGSKDDIALIRLSRPAVFSTYVRPLCLPSAFDLRGKTDFHGTQFEVAGWGRTENYTTSDIKLKVTVPGVSQANCQAAWRVFSKSIYDTQICAGGEAGKDSCNGDSGGPLITQHVDLEGNRYLYLAGLVSWGHTNCGMKNVPGVYTRVGAYMDWILEQMRA